MQVKNMKQRSLPTHNFAMNPRAQVQRSSFPVRQAVKTAFSASYLIPIYCEEVMPGDMFAIRCDTVARTATPIVPVQDNWHMDFHFFFCPNRLCWDNWEKFLGYQQNPADSIAYTVPQLSGTGGFAIGSLGDYFGLPTAGMYNPAAGLSVNALPFRAYSRIWNEWFRDQNLQNSVTQASGNGPDAYADYTLLKRGKRHDYFTAALPNPQKGTAVTIPLGTSAPVYGTGQSLYPASPITIEPYNNAVQPNGTIRLTNASTTIALAANAGATADATFSEVRQPLYADLTTASAASINTFRIAMATQQLLERDARGGTRYVETIFAHWGVRPPDFRLDRPEYIGGGSIPVLTDAIPQTSATGLTGGTTPAGNLAATGFARGKVGFSYAAVEHGYILGLVSVRADLTYSQGFRKHWMRSTRYDFPYPEFAHLGEQSILNKEIYADGSANDNNVFGYIPRYDECRHFPSMITGLYRPTAAGNIAYWHSSQLFSALPTLNATFIQDDTNTVLARNFAAGASAANQQFLCDFFFSGRVARPLPTHAVPGLTRF